MSNEASTKFRCAMHRGLPQLAARYVPVALEARAFFDARVPSFVGMPALKQYMLAQFVPTALAGIFAFGIHCWPGWGKQKDFSEAGTAA